MESLGQELKRRREQKNVSLKDVAEGTRVGIRFLHAIEADDFSALPGSVYARSFVRNYARFIGMDEEEAVLRYRKQTQTEETAEPQMPYQDYSSEPSNYLQWIIMGGLLVAIVGGSWGVIKYLERKNQQQQPPIANVTSPAPVATPSALPTTNPDLNAGNNANNGQTGTGAIPIPNATDPNGTNNGVVQPAVETENGLVLTLKTTGQSWVSVRADDQANAQILTIPTGESRDFRANGALKVTIGNLPAVQILLNGQPAKLPSNNGLVVNNVLISKENLQSFVNAAKVEAKAPIKPGTTGTKPAVKPANADGTKPTGTASPKPAGDGTVKPKPANPTNADGTTKPKPAGDGTTKPKPAGDGTTTAPKPLTSPKPVNPSPKPTNGDVPVKPKPTGTTNTNGTTTKPAGDGTTKPKTTGTTGEGTAKPKLNADGTVAKPKPTGDGTVKKPAGDGTAKPKPTGDGTPKPATPKPADKPKPKVNTEEKPQ